MKWVALALMLAGSSVCAEPLRIGVTTDYPPYSVTYPDGTRTGLDAALAEAICDMGAYDCVWVDLPFPSLFTALQAGEIDIAMGGIARTAARDAFIDFTCLYDVAESNSAWLYSRHAPADNMPFTVAVVGASLYELAARDAGYLTQAYPDHQSAQDAAIRGQTDGLVDAGGLNDPANGLIQRGEVPMQDAGAAIAVAESRPALRAALNEHLGTLSSSGALGEMQLFWFGTNQGDIVADCAMPALTS